MKAAMSTERCAKYLYCCAIKNFRYWEASCGLRSCPVVNRIVDYQPLRRSVQTALRRQFAIGVFLIEIITTSIYYYYCNYRCYYFYYYANTILRCDRSHHRGSGGDARNSEHVWCIPDFTSSRSSPSTKYQGYCVREIHVYAFLPVLYTVHQNLQASSELGSVEVICSGCCQLDLEANLRRSTALKLIDCWWASPE